MIWNWKVYKTLQKSPFKTLRTILEKINLKKNGLEKYFPMKKFISAGKTKSLKKNVKCKIITIYRSTSVVNKVLWLNV